MITTIFMHADGVDILLMTLGFLGAVGDGATFPVMLIATSKLMNIIAGLNTSNVLNFRHNINEGFCWTRTAERQASRLRIRYLKAVLRQDVGYFDLHVASTANVIASVSGDSLVIQDCISEKVPLFLRDVSTFIGAYVVGFLMIWRLALIAFPMVFLLMIPSMIYGRALMRISRKMRDEYSKAGSIVEQVVSSIRTVYSFVGERKSIEDYCVALEGCVELGVKQGLAERIVHWKALMSYYGSTLVMYNGAHGGNVFMVTLAISLGGIRSLSSGLSNIKDFAEAKVANEHVMEIMKRVPKIDSENMEGQTLDKMTGEIEFKHIEFAYPSRPESIVLKDFNLKIPRGKTVALVGGSGSGKSTVIALLQRFYDPLAGEILLDGVVINRLQPKWLRSQMGLVSQEPALFATTIKENILFGKEDTSMEQVTEAAKASNAHNFICQLPQGYYTKLDSILGWIADLESWLDLTFFLLLMRQQCTRHCIRKSGARSSRHASIGRTTIIVAHRLSTIRNADLIALVQNGQVKEIGSHNELIKNQENRLYASLVRLQQTEKPAGATIVSAQQSANRDDSKHTSIPSFLIEAKSTVKNAAVPSTSGEGSFKRLLAMNLPEWKQATLGCIGAILVGGVQPHYNFAVMGERLTKRVRERMLSKILTFEVGWYDKEQNSTAAICSKLADEASVVRSLVGDRMSLFIQTIAGMTIACMVGLVIAWRMSLVLFTVQPVIILCLYCKWVSLKSMSEKSIKAQEESSKLAAEAVTNLRTVTAFSSQAQILLMLKEAQEGPLHESIQQSWFAGIVLGTTNSLQSCTWALFFWYGGYLMAEGNIGAQALFQTFVLLSSNGLVIADLGTMTKDLARGTDAVSLVFATLDRYSLIEPEDSDGYKPKKITGHIEMCEVDFAYPARPNVIIFKGFSITIDAGKSTALVGQWFGESLRKHIALVSQEPTLFSGIIRENIAYGVLASEEVDESQIEAAKAANVHSFVSALEDGYDTWCGDRGLQLSGGQKQRIAIARAILKNPGVLLLDEATSALDSQSEKLVQDALERVMVRWTSVVMAHRLCTIQNCDAIVVLDKGKVVEKGTHSSL
ncbi:hypothetical protein H5410_062658 [Solanum commersonii]|uniref:Uncharacterized protein n=1 Tax=Solanum commersonii TaxID=4109 RepID=A0A9J5WC60_SOLCO|nr:hypothetical protein H5410_062658 [Solanum commersonii]